MQATENSFPSYAVTNNIINLVAQISELTGKVEITSQMETNPRLRRDNRIKTVYSTLAIENNSLSAAQVTALIDGKRVLGPQKDIAEVRNAFEAYDHLLSFNPYSMVDLLQAHKILMNGLVREAGGFRFCRKAVRRLAACNALETCALTSHENVAVVSGESIIHMAPPADMVYSLTERLLDWTERTETHPLIKSCVFHYEFEFIHPFSDGNGRMGRMWQTLLLFKWREIFAWLPVESIIKERQEKYYEAIRASTREAKSTQFIEFLLQAIADSLEEILSA